MKVGKWSENQFVGGVAGSIAAENQMGWRQRQEQQTANEELAGQWVLISRVRSWGGDKIAVGGDERQGIKNSKYYFSKKFGGKEGGGGITRLKECFREWERLSGRNH